MHWDEDAIEQLRCVAHVLQQRLKHLRQDEDTNESKSTDKGKQPMSALSSQSDNAQEAEMADILNLLVEVDTKMEELAQKPVINTDPLTDAVLKDTTAPTTSKLVNDITMLVRSTKKQTTSDESAAKRKADEETIDTTSGDEKRTKSQPESVADFVAGYVGGMAGLIVGSPLDVIKVRLQTDASTVSMTNAERRPLLSSVTAPLTPPPTTTQLKHMVISEGWSSWFRGIAPPIVGLAALNSILFASYGGISRLLIRPSLQGDLPSSPSPSPLLPLWGVFMAGCGAGTACFLVSTPTELVKCRAQILKNTRSSPEQGQFTSWQVTKQVFRQHGLTGFYRGGGITILRDALGYGVYFWAYEGMKRQLGIENVPYTHVADPIGLQLLLCGGIAGICTWASIYPMDVVKSRIQTQSNPLNAQHALSATECARQLYRQEGWRGFTRGLSVTLIRAFPVNAVTFLVYELVYKWMNTV
ncbi:mitochondrial carrier domain-containing protein [Syncephalis fuscata]|nr:mitochondrial carrier domain-containing protein [Syncephalis fuscata]